MAKAPFHTHLLTVDSSDSSPSLLFVASDTKRYLFNAPESLARVCVQSKLPMKKIERVFLGSLERSSGLPGLILSVCEGGGRHIHVHGPQGTLHYLASCRFFTRRSVRQRSPHLACQLKFRQRPNDGRRARNATRRINFAGTSHNTHRLESDGTSVCSIDERLCGTL